MEKEKKVVIKGVRRPVQMSEKPKVKKRVQNRNVKDAFMLA